MLLRHHLGPSKKNFRRKSPKKVELYILGIRTERNISLLCENHYATFRVKQRTRYANVKETFNTQVNVVSWVWGFTQGRFLFFLTVKRFTIKKLSGHGGIFSETNKIWLANVRWPTVICSPVKQPESHKPLAWKKKLMSISYGSWVIWIPKKTSLAHWAT